MPVECRLCPPACLQLAAAGRKNLIKISANIKLALPENDLEFLAVMNQFQLEGRYPDYLQGIYKKYKAKQTRKVIDHVTVLRKCLLKGLL